MSVTLLCVGRATYSPAKPGADFSMMAQRYQARPRQCTREKKAAFASLNVHLSTGRRPSYLQHTSICFSTAT